MQRQAPRCGTVRPRVQTRRRDVASAVPRPLPPACPGEGKRQPPPTLPAPTRNLAALPPRCRSGVPQETGRGGRVAARRALPATAAAAARYLSPPLLFPPPKQSICFAGVVHGGEAPCLVTPPLFPTFLKCGSPAASTAAATSRPTPAAAPGLPHSARGWWCQPAVSAPSRKLALIHSGRALDPHPTSPPSLTPHEGGPAAPTRLVGRPSARRRRDGARPDLPRHERGCQRWEPRVAPPPAPWSRRGGGR